MKSNLILFLVLPFLLFGQQQSSELEKFFLNHTGAFVLYDTNNDSFVRYNIKRCSERFVPASTFKIPNSIIGLETDVIANENFVIKWDQKVREIKSWNMDHDLASAIKYSVVPYYQELARRVGRERMQNFLDKFDYGTKTIGDRVDTFWLDNSLKISADEQIDFLKEFYNENLNASKRSIRIVKNIMSAEHYINSEMKFKTGAGQKEDGIWIGWLVGYVEQYKPSTNEISSVFLFAFNIDAGTFAEVSKLRNEQSRLILKHLRVIE